LSAWDRELAVARDAARAASEVLRRHYEQGTDEWRKGDDEPVTAADLEADEVIAARLRAEFPGDAVLSEERADDAARLGSARVWIVDPLDGTREFLARIPEFAVSIALALRGEPVVGVVHNPIAGVELWASKGGGAFRDGARTRVSDCARLEDAVLIASRSETKRGDFAAYEGWFREQRPTGSIAWKLAVVASGRAHGDLNLSTRPKNEWDVCAGDLLVREAGGRYLDFGGRAPRYNQPEPVIDQPMAAGNEALLARLFERLARARGAEP
jgi:myo-inositol-1(or 4)-monophosphatase